MKVTFTLLLLFLCLPKNPVFSQTVQDATVALSATVNTGPVSITLNWPNPANSTLNIVRRTKGQGGIQWINVLNAPNSSLTTFTDNNVVAGQTYEYLIERYTTIYARGYAHVAVQAPVTHTRGKLLLFIDADLTGPLATELTRLRDDLAGDGWQIIEHITGTDATVQSVKNQIVADRAADPANVKAVFLLGKIPIPYSGNTNWDGHPDHQGAWPADAYYGEVNGTWTDVSVDNSVPARAANVNVPGDGKFDQSILPSAVELQVGRVDFRRLTEATFGTTTVELLRRYLDKDHNWRTGAYKVDNKALVDDNFYYFNGEAFAENGYRNAYPLVGAGNIVTGDFFDNTNPQTYLMGYGCGGGWYSGAGGVGSSTNFGVDTVNIVFSNLFGSYHGDWDYEADPFMPAALASRGGILTCSWAGRPHYFYHELASGETIGYCVKETQNAQYNNGFFNSFGESGAHVSLLGDPTLRAFVVDPPADVKATTDCGSVQLEWAASPDTSVTGYYVYRSLQRYGAYTLLTVSPVTGTSFIDTNPIEDTLFYQVRAVKTQTSPGGGIFTNNSTGAPIEVTRVPTLSALIEPQFNTCNGFFTAAATVTGGTPPYHYLWTNGDTLSTTTYFAGNVLLAVTVTDAGGCTFESPETNLSIPAPLETNALIVSESGPGAADGSIQVGVEGGTAPYSFLWNTGATSPNLFNLTGGTYTVTVTDAAGCSKVLTYHLTTTTVATDEAALIEHLTLRPNPTTGPATLFLQLKKPASVRVELHDITGRVVWEQKEKVSPDVSVQFDLRDQAPGFYTVNIFIDNRVITRKLAVVR